MHNGVLCEWLLRGHSHKCVCALEREKTSSWDTFLKSWTSFNLTAMLSEHHVMREYAAKTWNMSVAFKDIKNNGKASLWNTKNMFHVDSHWDRAIGSTNGMSLSRDYVMSNQRQTRWVFKKSVWNYFYNSFCDIIVAQKWHTSPWYRSKSAFKQNIFVLPQIAVQFDWRIS